MYAEIAEKTRSALSHRFERYQGKSFRATRWIYEDVGGAIVGGSVGLKALEFDLQSVGELFELGAMAAMSHNKDFHAGHFSYGGEEQIETFVFFESANVENLQR